MLVCKKIFFLILSVFLSFFHFPFFVCFLLFSFFLIYIITFTQQYIFLLSDDCIYYFWTHQILYPSPTAYQLTFNLALSVILPSTIAPPPPPLPAQPGIIVFRTCQYNIASVSLFLQTLAPRVNKSEITNSCLKSIPLPLFSPFGPTWCFPASIFLLYEVFPLFSFFTHILLSFLPISL